MKVLAGFLNLFRWLVLTSLMVGVGVGVGVGEIGRAHV